MAIRINLDVMMARRKIGLTELSKEVDVTMANLSILKNPPSFYCTLENPKRKLSYIKLYFILQNKSIIQSELIQDRQQFYPCHSQNAHRGGGYILPPPVVLIMFLCRMFFLSAVNTHNGHQTTADQEKCNPQCHIAVISGLRYRIHRTGVRITFRRII